MNLQEYIKQIEIKLSPLEKYNFSQELTKKEYRQLATSYVNYLKYYLIIPPLKNGDSIDHKYSVSQGFKEKIDPKIINNFKNLRVISKKENSVKNRKCSIAKSTLLSYDDDAYWEHFIKSEHPKYFKFKSINYNLKNICIIKSKLIDDYNFKRSKYLLFKDIEGNLLYSQISDNALKSLNQIDTNKNYFINIHYWKDKGTYYVNFSQNNPLDFSIK